MKKFLCALLISLLGLNSASLLMATPDTKDSDKTKQANSTFNFALVAGPLAGAATAAGGYILGDYLAKTYYAPGIREFIRSSSGIAAFLVGGLWATPKLTGYLNAKKKRSDAKKELMNSSWGNIGTINPDDAAIITPAELRKSQTPRHPQAQPLAAKYQQQQPSNSDETDKRGKELINKTTKKWSTARSMSFYTNLTLGTIAAVTGFYLTAQSLKSK